MVVSGQLHAPANLPTHWVGYCNEDRRSPIGTGEHGPPAEVVHIDHNPNVRPVGQAEASTGWRSGVRPCK